MKNNESVPNRVVGPGQDDPCAICSKPFRFRDIVSVVGKEQQHIFHFDCYCYGVEVTRRLDDYAHGRRETSARCPLQRRNQPNVMNTCIAIVCRGVMDRALYRYDHKLPIGALNPNNVWVVDNVVLLPEVESGPEDYNYGGRIKEFVTGTFGETGDWEDYSISSSLLGTAGLNRNKRGF
ncbi:putative transcription factor C2H2 family [Rosa chinensis]|uniref:Putative transcription factor C2H2 family n=1 Tax=Rosa chinensis TaxID=74649 RepID=A0A2P6RJL3_ROSCH|nr:uncharacterized protein LOC112186715 [Rosa chinensis]PRQ46629.1 putative transcription factor C2H2 family [Rosa chinensis]